MSTEVSKWQRVIVSKIQRSSTKEKGSRIPGVKGTWSRVKSDGYDTLDLGYNQNSFLANGPLA